MKTIAFFMESYEVLVLCSLLSSFISIVTALSSVTPNQPINSNESNRNLVSASGNFEAGFFSFENSERRYFGIWYSGISPRTVVWVANRDTPLENSSRGVFKVTDRGNIAILDATGATIWSTNASTAAEKPVLQLLDSGNLVVNDGNNLLWQSFDDPGDTLLPGMKMESNLVTGEYKGLTCWRDTEDPARGEFSILIDTHGLPQQIVRKGKTLQYRAGSWNGFLFTGVPWERLYHFFNYSFVLTKKEAYFEYDLLNRSTVTRYVLSPAGLVQRYIWSDQSHSWEFFAAGPTDQCDNYAVCGPNSYCNPGNSPICECLQGFVVKYKEKWESSNWTDGCVRRINLSCNNGDKFLRYVGIKPPDTSSSWFDKSMSLDECKATCLKNCSCSAYANLDIRNGGSGCLLWFDNIMDMRKHPSEGQDICIRLAASELVSNQTWSKRHINKKKLVWTLVAVTAFSIGIIILALAIYVRRRKLEKPGKTDISNWNDHTEKNEKKDIDLPIIDLSIIANATNNFSACNILGEGGFGPVYKGALANGQEIAVKRLSKNSGQGPEEFKNEIVLIANLQHRNLVKILGCCIQDDERLLIYEFMPNRSLDYFIFERNMTDQTRSNLLDWNKRFQIINGIVRGLLYLHQDSRLRIIHRDLKTSNILLDNNMNPKISDFGLARTVRGDHTEANTKRVVGTHGYMPPEYAVYGSFSMKSDVFSFGVIVLEIISGRKNREFCDPNHHLNLLGHAWRLWSEERPLELINECLGDSVTEAEVILRCIHMGLLCVQERPEDRPDMSSIVLMLNGERPLPKPRQPAFYPHQQGSSSSGYCELSSSTNEMSITLLDAR